MNFEIEKLNIEEIILIKPKVFFDDRGYFLEIFKESDFKKIGLNNNFVQDNFSYSKKNILRGLHYQIDPYAQGKLVKVVKGKVLDVIVDVRVKSKNFKKWISIELSDENNYMLFIPPGFAHGFVSLTDEVRFLYKCTKEYSQDHEKGIKFNDPELNIDWKIVNPIVSKKDMDLPYLKDATLL